MTEKYNKYDVKESTGSVQTVEEFDALLEVFKRQNPAKYEAKLASGEFDKFRSKLVGFVPPAPPAPPALTKKELVEKLTELGVTLEGNENKETLQNLLDTAKNN